MLESDQNCLKFQKFEKKALTKLGMPNYYKCIELSKGKISMITAKSGDLSASLEDYLEAIFNLAGRSNVAHSKDIAKSMRVSRPSVTGALRVLKKKGLANYRPYDSVTLTKSGRAAAAKIVRNHNILKSFFANVLGVEPDIAQQAACRAEHVLGPKVISRLLCFIEFVTINGKDGHDIADEFERFCEKNS